MSNSLKESFILTNLDGTHRAVCSSMHELSGAIDHWMVVKPEESLIYEMWYTDLSLDAINWEFGYISLQDQDYAKQVAKDNHLPDNMFPKTINQNLVKEKNK